MYIGYNSFTAASGCSAAETPVQPVVAVMQSLFSGNLATDRGGGISLEAGSLQLQVGMDGIIELACMQPQWLAVQLRARHVPTMVLGPRAAGE